MEKVILAAGGVVENEKGEFLLIYRKKHWDLPKGKMDKDETMEECAVREVEEETGLKNVQIGKLLDTTIHHYEENGEQIVKKTSWYRMKASSSNKLVPQTEEQIEDLKWVNPAELQPYLKNTYTNIRQVLDKARGLA
jgi:8-oxo-dGTP pyrophosphatase MutT (NUDIX family)